MTNSPSNGMSLGTAIGLAEEAFKQKFHREIVVGSDSDKAWFNGYVEALTHDASQAETRADAALREAGKHVFNGATPNWIDHDGECALGDDAGAECTCGLSDWLRANADLLGCVFTQNGDGDSK